MDACTYLHYVTFIYAVFFCTQSICCEAPVRLFLYQSPNVYQVDVKEFVVVGRNDVLIGCTTTVQDDDSTDTRITLRNGERELESQNSSQLILNGKPFATSNLSCEIIFNNVPFEKVVINDFIIHHIKPNESIHCFPDISDKSYIVHEIVPILCTAGDNIAFTMAPSGSFTIGADQRHGFMGSRVLSNYIRVNTSGQQGINCKRRNSTESCTIQVYELENSLTVSISPTTLSNSSHDNSEYTCQTNVPTEYISWYVQFDDNDKIVPVAPGSFFNGSYVITQYTNSSLLVFPNVVQGLKFVSCSTHRAGHLATATAKNISSVVMEENDHVTLSAVTEVNFPSNNGASSRKGSTSLTPFITIIVILVIICIILAITTGFLIYQRVYPDRQNTAASKSDEPDHQDTAANERDVEMTTTQSSKANDDPYYYATSVQSDENRIDVDKDEKGPADSSYMEVSNGAEHLSSDMLEYGAVVVDNDAYQET
ncbi:hypothetical protein BSL78_22744 [Apostichopus japonicus]|uniref:Uncharacterized protein n=1 Tax=Stichopus japonicus TaxID=307972 RepID=A0A2G8JX85_STIJA|nr:hypothetical protein BSL78_22744 [Apostichopus japonicus]